MSVDQFEFKKSDKLPLFFFSHGGPTFAERNDPKGSNAGAWDSTHNVGRYIAEKVKPDFIIVVSAHWNSADKDLIEVSIPGPGESKYVQGGVVSNRISPEENALVYDFYNFPQRFYDSQFHSFPNIAIADDIVKTLQSSGQFRAQKTERGIDHGVFVPLKVAFGDVEVPDSKKWDVNVPVIQVSQAGTSDIETHYRLGQVLSKYRELNGVIIFSGMSVHNLRDVFVESDKPQPYIEPFNKILTDILTKQPKDELLEELKSLPIKEEYKTYYEQAHPTNEHLLPAIVGAGAADGDKCVEMYTSGKGRLGWNVYGWGEISDNLGPSSA